MRWAREEAADLPFAAALAHREYEAWLLAAIESLRGVGGVRADAELHPAPERPRDAKTALSRRMESHVRYLESQDQSALTAQFDLEQAFDGSRSFRKLVLAFGDLLSATGRDPTGWPAAWTWMQRRSAS